MCLLAERQAEKQIRRLNSTVPSHAGRLWRLEAVRVHSLEHENLVYPVISFVRSRRQLRRRFSSSAPGTRGNAGLHRHVFKPHRLRRMGGSDDDRRRRARRRKRYQ